MREISSSAAKKRRKSREEVEETKSDINLDGCHKEKGGGGKRRAVSIAHSNLGRAGFWRRCLPLAGEREEGICGVGKKQDGFCYVAKEKNQDFWVDGRHIASSLFIRLLKGKIPFFNGSPKEGKGGK